jgi:hypothetical protein
MDYFAAGPDMVRWERVALGPEGLGPCRLIIHHAAGSVTEDFPDLTAALLREGELEELLIAARSELAEPGVERRLSAASEGVL